MDEEHEDLNHTYVETHSQNRTLHANTAHKPGYPLIIINKPFLAIPNNSSLEAICYNCLNNPLSDDQGDNNKNQKLNYCTGCHVVKYCSTTCQKQSWSLCHKSECSKLGEIKKQRGQVPPTACRAAARLLGMFVKWRKMKISSAQPGKGKDEVRDWPPFALVGHEEEVLRQGGNAWSDLLLQAKMACRISGMEKGSEIEEFEGLACKLLCVMNTNAFELTSETPNTTNTPIGLCLSPTFAMANHSCSPNAIVRSNGRVITLEALEPIQENEEISIQYIQLDEDVLERRRKLRDIYFFECACQRCVKEMEEVRSGDPR